MKDRILNIFPIVLLIMILGIGVFNLFSPNVGIFWTASAVQLLTPLVAVCLTFFATQMKNDQREAKKHAEVLISKIQLLVVDEHFYKIVDTDDPIQQKEVREQIQITNRKMNNCIDSLISYSKHLKFESEANYIREEFARYRELIDASSTDFKSLSGLYIVLKKYAENIDSKCDRIGVKLYCPSSRPRQ